MSLLNELVEDGVLTERDALKLVDTVGAAPVSVLFVGPEGTPTGEVLEGLLAEVLSEDYQVVEHGVIGDPANALPVWATVKLTDDEADEPDFDAAFAAVEERLGFAGLDAIDYVVWLNQDGVEGKVVDAFEVLPGELPVLDEVSNDYEADWDLSLDELINENDAE